MDGWRTRMTDGNTHAINQQLDEIERLCDALQEVTAELEQAERDNILLIARIEELEAELEEQVEWVKSLVDDLIVMAELEAENEKLRKGLDIYQRERDRYKHATPEMSGAYFLTGGHGPKDDNQMPQFVEVVPAYGCGWSMIYEDTGRTISYEGL